MKTLFEAILDGMLIGPAKEAPQSIERNVKEILRNDLNSLKLIYADSMDGYDPTAVQVIDFLIKRWGLEPESNDSEKYKRILKALKSGDLPELSSLLKRAD